MSYRYHRSRFPELWLIAALSKYSAVQVQLILSKTLRVMNPWLFPVFNRATSCSSTIIGTFRPQHICDIFWCSQWTHAWRRNRRHSHKHTMVCHKVRFSYFGHVEHHACNVIFINQGFSVKEQVFLVVFKCPITYWDFGSDFEENVCPNSEHPISLAEVSVSVLCCLE